MMTEDKSNKLVNDLCKEVYKDNALYLVLVGDRTDNVDEIRGVIVDKEMENNV